MYVWHFKQTATMIQPKTITMFLKIQYVGTGTYYNCSLFGGRRLKNYEIVTCYRFKVCTYMLHVTDSEYV